MAKPYRILKNNNMETYRKNSNLIQDSNINEEFTKKVNKEIVEKIKKKQVKEIKENNRKQKWYFKFLK